MEYSYSAYGLSIASRVCLPELTSAPVPEGTGADLVINSAPGVSLPDAAEHYHIDRERAELFWPRVGHFTIERGCVITVTTDPEISEQSLRPYLLGPALAIALYQRNFTVLHCSAVALPDSAGELGVVAFLGRSGEGKSTLAAALHREGYRLFADDYLAIPPLTARIEGATAPRVYAGFPALRLGEHSLRALNETVALPLLYGAEHFSLHERREARYVQNVAQDFLTENLPLRCLYILQRNPPEVNTVQSEPLAPGRAMPLLLQNLYCAGLVGSAETAQQFLRCGEIATVVPVRLLQRPNDLSRLSESVAQVRHDSR